MLINDYQKQRFVERVIEGMFNTVNGKSSRHLLLPMPATED